MPQLTTDTLATALTTLPLRMEGIPKPSSLSSEHWVGWVLLSSLLLLLSAWIIDCDTIVGKFHFDFKQRERDSIFQKSTLTNIYAQFAYFTYSLLTASLLIHSYTSIGDTNLGFGKFAQTTLYTSSFFMGKYFILRLLQFTFDPLSRSIENESWPAKYYKTLCFFCTIGFIALIITTFGAKNTLFIQKLTFISISLSACLALTIRLFQIFLNKTIGILYIMLYLCAFEILPFIAFIKVLSFLN